MNRNIIIGIVIVIALGTGYYFFSNMSGSSRKPTDTSQTIQISVTPAATDKSAVNTAGAVSKTVTVNYGANGFSPKEASIAKGDTVNFVAGAGSDKMWIGSAPHPTHEGYDGTTKSQHCEAGYTGPVPFDQCQAGTSYSFTFLKAGAWGYHNHVNSGDFGKIIVK